MERNQLETKEQYAACLHEALTHIARIMDRGQLAMSMGELALACGVPIDRFLQHFPSIDVLLENTIDRMTILFERQVQAKIATCTLLKKKKVLYFLRCVRRYLEHYPEAGYLFTMHFLGDVMVSRLHTPLEKFTQLWYDTLFDCLNSCAPAPLAKRMTDTYLISLRGQCQLVNIDNIISASAHAERFLLATLKHC